MAVPPPPTLDFYERAGCAICAEARDMLQQVLEDRAKRGESVPRVRFVDIGGRADLEGKYAAMLPVLALAGRELYLNTSYQAIARFLDAGLPRLA